MPKKRQSIVSLDEAKAATLEARKRARNKSRAKIPAAKNVEDFNRWLKETYPEYKRVG